MMNKNNQNKGIASSSVFPRAFSRSDWLGFAVVFVITLIAYTWTLAPTVTLEDSGELVVAADYLGVPHPPGYPLWTVLAWFFTRVFRFKTYMGQPNPAWGVNFLSAFFGALTSAVVALLISRVGRDLLRFQGCGNGTASERGSGSDGAREDRAAAGWITCVSGIGAGLLLTFSPLQWSQSVIAEVYTLNTFIVILLMCLSYVWIQHPERGRIPYYIAFLFGLAITNYQPIVLLVPALMILFFAADRALFRDALASGLVFVALWIYIFRVRPLFEAPGTPGLERSLWSILAVAMILSPIVIRLVAGKLFTEWKHILIMAGCMALGLCMFIYMPIASDQNPPMNWGYARTWEGFKHAVTRGQYQALAPAVAPTAFLKQFAMYFMELEWEFTLPPLLLALLILFFYKRIRVADRMWFAAVLVGFLCFGVGMLVILNPGHDIQSMFIARVQLLQSLAMCALFIGGGFVLGLGFLESVLSKKLLLAPAFMLILLSPTVLLWRNAYDEELIKSYGAANLNGFDFGWQFGCFQLCGAPGIARSLAPDEPPLPNPDYPPPMTTNAIFFGGTDPGRFVPTYMIFSARVRPDVFLITQNALADNTYMSVMRDLYGDLIWIPTPHDSNQAFQSYVNDVRSGRVPATAAITVDDSGRVSVQGVQGVMEINGIICRMIFDKNKHKHDFYIEESYVINWMYPYLEPHGLIMKINKEPLPGLTEEMIRNDMEFWGWYTARLLNNKHFLRSAVARKSFSKLRCAIAGLYAFRGLFNEAEAAYKQAVEISPISPEANFRLADLYLQQGRFHDAYAVMERNLSLDPRNEKIQDFMNQIQSLAQYNERMAQLQTALSNGVGTLETVFELASIYKQTGRQDQFYNLTRQLLHNEDVPPEALLKLAEMYSAMAPPRPGHIAEVLEVYLRREPGNPRVWLELACIRAALTKNQEALQALREAINVGGDPIRQLAARDNRLAPLRHMEEYQQMIQPRHKRMHLPGIGIP